MNKRFAALLLIFVLLLSSAGCMGQKDAVLTGDEENLYYPKNEIMTIEDVNDGRMVIVIDTQYNVSTSDIEQVVESKFPEVNVVLRLQNTPDSVYQTQKSLEYGLLGDIFFCTTGLSKDENLGKYFMDLSDMPFINNYYQNALDGVAVNGKIYMLPGFSGFYGIIYDKTLFLEQGWEVPQSRDEFIALCKTINETTGNQAFMPTLRFGRMAMMLSHAFHYKDVIAGAKNQTWLQEYRMGEAGFSGHMEPMFEGMKELFDAGVLSLECLEIEAGVRSAMLYKEHTTAMTMESQNALFYAKNAESDHEYGMMPFWNGNDEDDDYLVSTPGFQIYANKELELPQYAKKREKVIEILDYLSTPEGQRSLMSEESAAISNVKGTDASAGGDFMADVEDTIAKGNIFHEVRYTDLTNNNPFQVAFREALIGYLEGTMDLKAAMEYCDEAMQEVYQSEQPKETVYGEVTENFTVMETSEFVADIFRKKAGADVGLVLAKKLTYGETGNFFAGDITDTMLNFVSLDYVSGREPSYNQLVTVQLTGAQILSILNYPYLNRESSDNPSVWLNSNQPSYWVPSNLKLEYAPLLPQNGVLNITNMDGSTFDLEKTYKVAIWNGCFSNIEVKDYFDEDTLAAMADVVPVSDETSIELIKSAVEEAGVISPPDDGRITIRWDVTPKSD